MTKEMEADACAYRHRAGNVARRARRLRMLLAMAHACANNGGVHMRIRAQGSPIIHVPNSG